MKDKRLEDKLDDKKDRKIKLQKIILDKKEERQELSFQEIWKRNQQEFQKHNLTSIKDLTEFLNKIVSSKIEIPLFSSKEASYLLKDIQWMRFIKSPGLREKLIEETDLDPEKIEQDDELEKLKAFILDKKIIEEQSVKSLISDIKEFRKSEKIPFSPEKHYLHDAEFLKEIFHVNPLKLLGKKGIFVGQLFSENTNLPISNHKIVAKIKSKKKQESKVLGSSISNKSGYFSFYYQIPMENEFLHLEVYDLYGIDQIYEKSFELEQEQDSLKPVKIIIPSKKIEFENITKELKLEIPNQIKKELNRKEIYNLTDILKKGGIQQLGISKSEEDRHIIKNLESLASYQVLSENISLNHKLVKLGFNSPSAIARTKLNIFVKQIGEHIGESKAIQIHQMAKAQSALLNNFLLDMKTDWATFNTNSYFMKDNQSKQTDTTGTDTKETKSSNKDVPPPPLELDLCFCKDCRSAVSPLAYLTDLIAYISDNVVDLSTNNHIDIDYLTSKFHQLFSELSTDCESMDEKVLQARICVEVLMSYIKDNWPECFRPGLYTNQFYLEQDFGSDIKSYLLDSYNLILENIGLDSIELRILPIMSDDERESLAVKIGIPGSNLDELYLDFDSDPFGKKVVNARNLERIFGIINPFRHPLSDGAKSGDYKTGPIKKWDLAGIEWNANTDEFGIVYALFTHTGVDTYSLDLFKDKNGAEKVATGTYQLGSENVPINEVNNSGISGTLTVDVNYDLSEILSKQINLEILAVPFLEPLYTGQIVKWKFSNVQWKLNTDIDGNIYITIEKDPGTNEITVSCYKDASLSTTALVATGSVDDPKGTVVLYEENMSGLNGELELNFLCDSRNIEVSLIPNFVCWRLTYLREMWTVSDWPLDYPENNPLIDPDIIGPDDFRTPYAKAQNADPDKAFDVWKRRRIWIDDLFDNITSIKMRGSVSKIPDWDGILDFMKQNKNYHTYNIPFLWPQTSKWSDLESLHENLSIGNDIDAIISEIVETYHMTVYSLNRLLKIREKDLLFKSDPTKEKVKLKEWRELYYILVEIHKKAMFEKWLDEEATLGIKAEFGPNLFWNSLKDPEAGDWRIVFEEELPVIDPEFMGEEEAELLSIRDFILWQARKAKLDKVFGEIKATNENDGFDNMLLVVFGNPLPFDFNQIKTKLGSGNDIQIREAEDEISNVLFMNRGNFDFLYDLRERYSDGDVATDPTDEEWEELYVILSRSYKERVEYPNWKIEESNNPLIDPDFVKKENLTDSFISYPVHRMWESRKDELEGIYEEEVKNTHKTTNLDSLLISIYGAPLEFDVDKQNLDSGDKDLENEAIIKITTIYQLAISEFNQIQTIRENVISSDPNIQPTDDDWEEVYTILTRVIKAKTKKTLWKDEENVLGVQYWNVIKAKLPTWVASIEDRVEWQLALQYQSLSPIIDPYKLAHGNIRNPAPDGSPALSIEHDRRHQNSTWFSEIETLKENLIGPKGILAAYDQILLKIFKDETISLFSNALKNYRQHEDLDYVLEKIIRLKKSELVELANELGNADPEINEGAKHKIRTILYMTIQDFEDLMDVFDRLNNGVAVPDPDWENIYSVLTKYFFLNEIFKLKEDYLDGKEIQSRLDQLHLTLNSLEYLLDIRNLIIRDIKMNSTTVQQDEWVNAFSIIYSVFRKRKQFNQWRKEEKNQSIILCSDQFGPKADDVTFKPYEWISTWGDHSDWERKLQGRNDQEQSIISSYNELIQKTEEYSIPLLRVYLIKFILYKDEEWVLNNFLIDAQIASCFQTTRVSQAIETLQSFVWALRSGDTIFQCQLVADNFDEEWKWLGSYASWRAALFAYMYPENILFPSLRPLKWQTPAFQELNNQLNSLHRFRPKDACTFAFEYTEYFFDICNLNTLATCVASTRNYDESCDNRNWVSSSSPNYTESGYQDLLYIFANSCESGKVYWSTFNLSDISDPLWHVQLNDVFSAQTAWKPLRIESIEVDNVLGAVPYKGYLLVFGEIKEDNESEYVLLRLNLDNGKWEDNPITLEVPDSVFRFIVGMQTHKGTRPTVIIQDKFDGDLYINQINNDCDNWIEEDWEEQSIGSVFTTNNANIPGIWASNEVVALVVEEDNGLLLTREYGSTGLNYVKFNIQYANLNEVGMIGMGRYTGIYPFFSHQDLNKRIGVYFIDNLSYIRVCIMGFAGVQQMLYGDKVYNLAPISFQDLKPDDPRVFVYGHYREQHNVKIAEFKKNVTSSPYHPPYLLPTYNQTDITHYLSPFISDLTLYPINSDENPLDAADGGPVDRKTAIRENMLLYQFANRSIQSLFEEAYYFVPLFLAMKLEQNKCFMEALDWYRTVFDYTKGEANQKIYYGLIMEESSDEILFQRVSDWLLDPINPHEIARTRPNTYSRFTILSIIRCLLAYADNEYTQDTIETVSKARKLYLTVLKLLENSVLKQGMTICPDIIGTLEITIEMSLSPKKEYKIVYQTVEQKVIIIELDGNKPKKVLYDDSLEIGPSQQKTYMTFGNYISDLANISQRLKSIQNRKELEIVVQDIRVELKERKPWKDTIKNVYGKITDVKLKQKPSDLSSILSNRKITADKAHMELLSYSKILSPVLNSRKLIQSKISERIRYNAEIQPLPAEKKGSYLLSSSPSPPLLSMVYQFCIPINPYLELIKLITEINLYKIRTCRNIAGLERSLEPYAAPTDTISGLPTLGFRLPTDTMVQSVFRPTPYRYKTLIERAKELIQLADRFEAAMLSAIEKRDSEEYSRLRAEQDIQLNKSREKFQKLRVKEAEQGKKFAELKVDRALIQVNGLQEMIDAGLNEYETTMINAYNILSGLKMAAQFLTSAQEASSLATDVAAAGPAAGAAAGAATAGIVAIMAKYLVNQSMISYETIARVASVWASYERRKQEWEFQQKIAKQDVKIATQEVEIADTRIDITEQEQKIAELSTRHAEDVKNFLVNKFTNVELYDWMSNILEGVYSYFLQQATSIAKLAEHQLAFERQQYIPPYIQADYWTAPSEMESAGGKSDEKERRGLTGSARLLKDVYQLDQYAFETDKRKLQLTKTISLATTVPVEFQLFRENGKIVFSTPMGLFDRDFPGHYIRLIKIIKITIIALISPIEGIKATLFNPGISRIVIGPEPARMININLPPQLIAFTSPIDATGIFELTPQYELLNPFEGFGVDTTWELTMPKSANLFDYSTIVDVLLTIDYTALESSIYREQLLLEMGNIFQAEKPLSFRHNFPDQWYRLHNPDQTSSPITVYFETKRADFPPNLVNLKIEHVVLHFSRADGVSEEIPVNDLLFTEEGGLGTLGGSAETVDGIISTRRGNAGSWIPILGRSPIGLWELVLPNTSSIRNLFDKEKIEEILFVISYTAVTPQWPK